jgi:O-antigen ligase
MLRLRARYWWLQLLTACAVGGGLGVVSNMSPLYGVVAVSAAAFGVAVLLSPIVGIVAMLVLRSSVAYEASRIFMISLFEWFYLSDLVLILLLAIMTVRMLLQPTDRPVWSSLVWPIAILVVLALLTAIMAVERGTDLADAVGQLRVVTYYLLFMPVAYFINDRRSLHKLIVALRLIALAVSLASIVQILVGSSLGLRLAWAGGAQDEPTGRVGVDALRVMSPGTTLVYWMFMLAVCRLMTEKGSFAHKGFVYIETGLLGTSLLLTFTRTLWASLIFVFGLMAILASPSQRARLVPVIAVMGAAIVSGLLVLWLLSGSIGLHVDFVDAIVERSAALFSLEKAAGDENLNYRRIETGYALQAIQEHPWLGIGPGTIYRPPMNMDEAANRPRTQRSFVHDAYIWAWLKLGVGGLIALLWLAFATLWHSWRGWKRATNPFLSFVLASCFFALAGELFLNVTWEFFFSIYSAPTLATLFAVCSAAARLTNDQLEPSPSEQRDFATKGAVHKPALAGASLSDARPEGRL